MHTPDDASVPETVEPETRSEVTPTVPVEKAVDTLFKVRINDRDGNGVEAHRLELLMFTLYDLSYSILNDRPDGDDLEDFEDARVTFMNSDDDGITMGIRFDYRLDSLQDLFKYVAQRVVIGPDTKTEVAEVLEYDDAKALVNKLVKTKVLTRREADAYVAVLKAKFPVLLDNGVHPLIKYF